MDNEEVEFMWDDFDLAPEEEIVGTQEETPKEPTEEVEEDIEPEESEDSEEVVIEEELDEFAQLDKEELEGEVEEEEEAGDYEGSIQTLEYLRDTGRLDFELEEGEELTDERAAEILEDSMFEAQENRIKELVQDLPPVVQDLVKFSTAGGKVEDFLKTMQRSTEGELSQDLDMDQEFNQKLVMRRKFESEGYDEDYTETMIDALEDKGKLEAMSKAVHNKWSEEESIKQQQLVEEQKQKQIAIKKRITATLNESRRFFKDSEVDGFTLSKKDRSDLPGYINTRTVDQGEGRYVSPMYRDLVKVLDTPVGVAQIAALVRNHKDGVLDFSHIESKAVSNTTKKFKENIRRAKSKPSTKANKTGGKIDLADFF